MYFYLLLLGHQLLVSRCLLPLCQMSHFHLAAFAAEVHLCFSFLSNPLKNALQGKAPRGEGLM